MRIQGYCTSCRKIRYVRVHVVPLNSIAWGVCRECEEKGAKHG